MRQLLARRRAHRCAAQSTLVRTQICTSTSQTNVTSRTRLFDRPRFIHCSRLRMSTSRSHYSKSGLKSLSRAQARFNSNAVTVLSDYEQHRLRAHHHRGSQSPVCLMQSADDAFERCSWPGMRRGRFKQSASCSTRQDQSSICRYQRPIPGLEDRVHSWSVLGYP